MVSVSVNPCRSGTVPLPQYVRNLRAYPDLLSHRTYCFMPHLWGLLGKYCLKESLPLNFTILSSIDTSHLGVYAAVYRGSHMFNSGRTFHRWSKFGSPRWGLSASLSLKCKNEDRASNRFLGITSLNAVFVSQ